MEQPINKGKRWAFDDTALLEDLYAANINIIDIAKKLGRTEGSVEQQLAKLIIDQLKSVTYNEICQKYNKSIVTLQTIVDKWRYRIESKQKKAEIDNNRSFESVRNNEEKDNDRFKESTELMMIENENKLLEAKIKNINLKLQLKELMEIEKRQEDSD